MEARRRYAQELVDTNNMEATVVVYTMDDDVSKQFGLLPNMVYIIDKEGKIAYKSDWTEQPRIDLLLEELIAEQAGVGAGA